MSAGHDPWRVLVVDDEPPARALITALVAEDPEFVSMGACSSVDSAVHAIQTYAPDLVLLDMQLGERTGFEVIQHVGVMRMPPVVFVTAYDEHAVAAFDAHALDYILKPIDSDRFHAMLDRAKRQLATQPSPSPSNTTVLMEQLSTVIASRRRIPVKHEDRIVMVLPHEIDRVEVEHNHVWVFQGTKRYLARETLSAFVARLPEMHFVRVNRSTVVNIDRVREVQPWFHGELALLLADGTRVTTGRSFRERVRKALGLA